MIFISKAKLCSLIQQSIEEMVKSETKAALDSLRGSLWQTQDALRRIGSEKFLDEFVERVNRKQLKS